MQEERRPLHGEGGRERATARVDGKEPAVAQSAAALARELHAAREPVQGRAGVPADTDREGRTGGGRGGRAEQGEALLESQGTVHVPLDQPRVRI